MSDEENDNTLIKVQNHKGPRDENGLYTGRGKTTYENKDQYIGLFKEGRREGLGTYRWAFLNAKYRGEYKNGLKHGKGTMQYTNQCVYTGEYVNGKREGQGKMEFPNLDYYEGEFKNGLPNGQGTYFYFNCKVTVKGEFVNGKIVKGQIFTPNNEVLSTDFCCGAPCGNGFYMVNHCKQTGKHEDLRGKDAPTATKVEKVEDPEKSIEDEAAEDYKKLLKLREEEAKEKEAEGGDEAPEGGEEGQEGEKPDPREGELKNLKPQEEYRRRTGAEVLVQNEEKWPVMKPKWIPNGLPIGRRQ